MKRRKHSILSTQHSALSTLFLALLLGAGAGCQSERPMLDPRDMDVDQVHRGQMPDNDSPKPNQPKKPDTDSLNQPKKPDGDNAKPIETTSFLDRSPERGPGQGGVVVNGIRATVGKVPILDKEVMAMCMPEIIRIRNSTMSDAQRTCAYDAAVREALDRLIDREVVIQEAEHRLGGGNPAGLKNLKDAADQDFERYVRRFKTANKLNSDAEFDNFLKTRGMQRETLRLQHEHEFIYSQYLHFRIQPITEKVGHMDIMDYYQQHPEEFQVADSVQWQDIFLDVAKMGSDHCFAAKNDLTPFLTQDAARKFAEGLAARVRKGEDFAKLAAQFDNGPTRGANGEGVRNLRGEVSLKEAEPILFQMHDGDMAIVELKTGGCHLIRLVKRQYAGLLPLDDKVQKQIREKLKMEIYQREAKRIIQELRRKTPIEIAKGTD